MQASFEGQSASILHSGSGSGSRAVQKKSTSSNWKNPEHLTLTGLRDVMFDFYVISYNYKSKSLNFVR